MSRWIKYTFSASAPPVDPDENNGIWYQTNGEIGDPIPYPVGGGHFKARAWEDGESSAVTSASFEREPTDYIAYYPLTADFNDHAGSNNLVNTGCTVDGNGCSFDNINDTLTLTNAITWYDSITFVFTVNITALSLAVLLCDTWGSYQYMRIEGSSGQWSMYSPQTGQVYASTPLTLGLHKIAIVQGATSRMYYIDGVLALTIGSPAVSNLKYLGNYTTGGYGLISVWKDIKIFNRAVSELEAIQLTTE